MRICDINTILFFLIYFPTRWESKVNICILYHYLSIQGDPFKCLLSLFLKVVSFSEILILNIAYYHCKPIFLIFLNDSIFLKFYISVQYQYLILFGVLTIHTNFI